MQQPAKAYLLLEFSSQKQVSIGTYTLVSPYERQYSNLIL